MAEFREPVTFGVSQTQSPLKQPLQHAVLLAKEGDHVVPLTRQPPVEHRQYELERKHD